MNIKNSTDNSTDIAATITAAEKTQANKEKPKQHVGMGGFAKGLSVIEAFGDSGEALSIAEVSRISGLDRATTRRCLLTLESTGYAKSNNRKYRLTPRILRLSSAYLNAPLPKLIQPSVENLASKVNESCSAAVLDGNEIMYIARASHNRVMSIGLTIGSRLPAYCTSMGRVLLASLPTDEVKKILQNSQLDARTDKTITNPNTLLTEIEKVQNQGYSINEQELEIGLRSIAVPISNGSNKVVAALNIGVHAAHATVEQLTTDFLPHMLELQHQLSEIIQ